MAWDKSFDEELAQILTDYRNQSWIDPDTGQILAPPDTSIGSLVFISAAVLASAKWGLHRHQSWIARQIFADTADSANLEHWCWTRGIYRNAGESDASLLARYLIAIREPAAGGNRTDYVRWALEVATVAAAWCIPLGNGPGTIDVLILAAADATGSEIPDQALLDAVHTYIDARNPAEMHADDLRVMAPFVVIQDVTMTIAGTAADPAEVAADITAYLAGMTPGQDLHPTRLAAFAIAAGEDSAEVATPAAPVATTEYQVIRPGVITVTVG
ncbi:MAG: hypothetical protein VR64_20595 [Desulfatitalea sp. BRH_c12]|nr:MAG: hypothetical protein VR64_20595 [Desulfatitalea sp. BRH_c12]